MSLFKSRKGLNKTKDSKKGSKNIPNKDTNTVKTDTDWYKLEPNEFSIDLIKSIFIAFNEDGLKDEIIAFLTVYMMYMSERDDRYLSYFKCTDSLKQTLVEKLESDSLKENYSNVEFKDFAVVGAEKKPTEFIITTQVSVFYTDIGSVMLGNKPLEIGVKKIFEIDYTIYKDTFNYCTKCGVVVESDSCSCGDKDSLKVLNKKLVSRVVERGV